MAIVPPSETGILNPVGFRALGYEKAYWNRTSPLLCRVLLLAFRLLYNSTLETLVSEVRELPPFGLVFRQRPAAMRGFFFGPISRL